MRTLSLLVLLVIFTLSPRWGSADPYLVKDIYPGSGSSPQPPKDLFAVDNTLYFVAYGVDLGVELWKSDGTNAGTMVVKDIRPGPGNSDPKIVGSVNGVLIFEAWDGVSTRGLWRTDGTDAGTYRIKDLTISWTFTDMERYTEVIGNTLYFAATDSTHGAELWRSDGTAIGTVMVKDIVPGSTSSYIDYLINFNGILFFAAFNGTSEIELWRSDGTTLGTWMFKDIVQYSSSGPQNLTVVNEALFFTADNGVNGRELWKSDGTVTGTNLLKDIYLGTNTSNPSSLTNVNGILFFTATDGTNGTELWKSDGTSAGTVLFKDINLGSSSSFPQCLTNVNGTLFFRADNDVNGMELWKSDGTAAGTVMVKDIRPGSSSFNIQNLININGNLFFTLDYDQELWKSDGTVTGTVMVKILEPGSSSYTKYLTNVNGTLFFIARDSINDKELWALNTNGKAPVINSISDAVIPDDQSYTGPTPVLTDGTAPLTWSIVQGPTGMTINTSTGVASWLAPVTTGSPFTVTIRATNDFGQADATWKLTVYHPGPPSSPQGKLKVTYHIETPSVSPDGQPVQYTYVWTSDKGDRVTHGPTLATSDTLMEMNLVQDGETWTVRATPTSGSKTGTAAVATVKFVDIHSGVAIWSFYK